MLDKNSIIGIIGAGVMGRGIAQVAARAKHSVILYDNFDGAVENAMNANEKELAKLVEKGKITQETKELTMSKIQPSKQISDLKDCDLIIEAIIENKEIKQKIFKELENICKQSVVIASNTSSISISALANGLKRPANLIGIHFFNPAPIMNLVEIIKGLQSDELIVKEAHALITSWGKKAVFAKSSPGFIVNRIARPFYAEALRLYEEGVSDFATIDESLRNNGGFRMGAFELMDLIGNDTNYAVTCSTYDSYYQDKRFEPSITQKEFADAGLLGRKSNGGFYNYENGKKIPQNPKIANPTNEDIKEITIKGDLKFASSLIELFEATNLKVNKTSGDGCISFNGIDLYLADGLMISQKENPNSAQFDISLDYKNTTSILIATSLKAKKGIENSIAALFAKIQKQVLVIKDSPALISLRVIASIINEANSAIMNGICDEASADIAMENGVNYPIGPFKWLNLLGIDYVLETLNNLENFYKDTRYRANRILIEKQILKEIK